MSGLNPLRHMITAALLVGSVAATSGLAQSPPSLPLPPATAPGTGTGPLSMPSTTSAPAPTLTGPSMPAPGTMPDLNAPIASINGKDINSRAFYDIMTRGYGMRTFSVVFDLMLAQDACRVAGVSLEGKDFTDRLFKEADITMDGMGIPKVDTTKEDAKKLTPEEITQQRLGYVGALLQQQGKSVVEFRLLLETRAELRAIAKNNVTVTQKEIDDAYDSEYGPKRRIKIMTWPEDKPTMAADIKKALATMKPEAVAVNLGLNQPQTWTISENANKGENAKNIEKIYNIAFHTLNKAGDASDAQPVPANDGKDHPVIVYLDEVIKDTYAANPKATVANDLKEQVTIAKENQWMDQYLVRMRANAAVVIKDPILADEYKQLDEMYKQAAARAATQTAPATSPASAPAAPK